MDAPNLVPQSGMVSSEEPTSTEMARTLQFVDENEAYTTNVEGTMDSTRYTTADSNTELSNFFERPVEVYNVEWPVNGNLDIGIQPWRAWFENPRVQNRLSNYRNFKGNLKVKFLINGNQFYWGKAFVSYHPLPDLQPFLRFEDNFLSTVPALQRPHIWLDPTTSQGGQLSLPFYYHYDNIDLTLKINHGLERR